MSFPPKKPSIPAIQPVATPNIKKIPPLPTRPPRTATRPTIKPPGLPPDSPRVTKTPFLNHTSQHKVGGAQFPGFRPPIGNKPAIPPPTPPGVPRIPLQHPNLPGTQPRPSFVPRQQRPPHFFEQHFPQRPFMRDPDHFRQFDHRFDDERVRNNCFTFREEFDDDDRGRFFPFVQQSSCGQLQLLQHILGFSFGMGLSSMGRDQPDSCGTWVIGADGLWFKVSDCSRGLIDQIENQRTFGSRAQAPIVIPC